MLLPCWRLSLRDTTGCHSPSRSGDYRGVTALRPQRGVSALRRRRGQFRRPLLRCQEGNLQETLLLLPRELLAGADHFGQHSLARGVRETCYDSKRMPHHLVVVLRGDPRTARRSDGSSAVNTLIDTSAEDAAAESAPLALGASSSRGLAASSSAKPGKAALARAKELLRPLRRLALAALVEGFAPAEVRRPLRPFRWPF